MIQDWRRAGESSDHPVIRLTAFVARNCVDPQRPRRFCGLLPTAIKKTAEDAEDAEDCFEGQKAVLPIPTSHCNDDTVALKHRVGIVLAL